MSYYLIAIHRRRFIGPFRLRSEVVDYLFENAGTDDVAKALKAMGLELTETVNPVEWQNKQKG